MGDLDPSHNTETSKDDVTLDVGPGGQEHGASGQMSATSEGRHCAMALVEGSDVCLSSETLSLLRRRLRLAASLIFFGFFVFLPLHYLQGNFSEPGSRLLLGFHVLATVVLGGVGLWLWTRRPIGMVGLRAVELAVFGLSAAFFLAMQYFVITAQCHELAVVRQQHAACQEIRITLPGGMWLLLIFTYALFIPNTFRRAAAVIGAIAAMPIVMMVFMLLTQPAVHDALSWKEMASFPLMLIVAAVTGLFGVDTIGSLRRQAFEARQLGQYRLKQRIGAGGMGEVFLAEHQLLKRPCVVKLIRPDKAGDARALMRFQREVRSTAKLTHWNTVEIFDYGVATDGTFYYVMEHLSGMGLGELVERFGPMDPARVIYLLLQACDALGEAHAAGLLHRDIKPANIFAARLGGVYDVVKLLDFGLVKPIVDDQDESLHLTTEGSITGSPLFMSPEQATGEGNPDARSDIYSLGAVGYFMLTGRPPFSGDRPIKVMIAHVRDEVQPPSKHRPDLPDDLEQVILRCLAKRPEDRYPNAAALAEALASCQAAGDWDRARAAAWWSHQQKLPSHRQPETVEHRAR